MLDQIIELFPEFSGIYNNSLRTKTLNCWHDAMKLGKWQPADLDDIPFTLLIPNCKTSFRTHVRAVTRTALESAKVLTEYYSDEYSLNMDILCAGGLLHDIGKLLEYEKVDGQYVKSRTGTLLRHPFSGAGLALKHGLPDEIIHIIATHAKEGDGGYRCPEAIIIHHADFMNFEPLKL